MPALFAFVFVALLASAPPPAVQRPAKAAPLKPRALPPAKAFLFRQGQQCDHFVYLDDGKLKLQGQPFPLKSVNFRIEIVGRDVAAGAPAVPGVPRVVLDGKPLDLFLTAYGSYSPDNNSWCRDDPSWNPDMRCCSDAASCAADLETQAQQLQALGVNSVRLLMDYFKIRNGVPTFSIGRIPWPWKDTYLDLRDPAQRAAAMELQKRAVQFLGAHGVRSLMLLNGFPYLAAKSDWNSLYRSFVSGLSLILKDEPYLLGFDFSNEPTWSSGAPANTEFGLDKGGARDLVKTWVSAVRNEGQNPHALLTIGNAFTLAALDAWDPAYLPIDFNSNHIYPPSPTSWSASHSFFEKETFLTSLGACGNPCQAGTQFDGANCVVRAGPVGSDGHIEDEGTFYFTGRADACPQGALKKGKCTIASYLPGRDDPFVLPQTLYYVKAKNRTCPQGSSFDGANCSFGAAPPGAKAFTLQKPRAFYYQYVSQSGAKCRPPASDDGANCFVAAIPAGWEPFQLQQPVFYVKAVHCDGGRKPVIIGEFGASVNEVDIKTGAITKATDGDQNNQATYLRAGAERARDCGYQGVQWWQHGDVHWGNPHEDHLGLWADYRQVYPGKPWPAPDAMAMRPAGQALHDLDLSSAKAECAKPADWSKPVFGQGISGSKFRYIGKVFNQHLKGVPYALLTARLSGGGSVYFNAFTDAKGAYDFTTPKVVEKIHATQFGHATTRWHIPVPLVPTLIELKKAAPADLPAYAPPNRDDSACRTLQVPMK